MIRLPARLALIASAVLVLAAPMNAPLAAQQSPGTFSLPPARPKPAPVPAGPADERAGVVILPRAQPTATPTALPAPAPAPAPAAIATPDPAPSGQPSAGPATASQPALQTTAPQIASAAQSQATEQRPGLPATSAASPAPSAALLPPLPGATPQTAQAAPAPEADGASDWALPPVSLPALPEAVAGSLPPLPGWWMIAAGALGALVLLGGAALLRRRRKPKVLRLAAHPTAAAAGGAEGGAEGGQGTGPDLADLHITLEVTAATRSVMMFTLGYRLTIANRSGRAINDLHFAVQLACARASAGKSPAAGSAQALGDAPRLGPHQARSITGEVQIPITAIQPLRQGATPLFVPLVHVTLEGEDQRALTKTFVIGSPSASGRVHPIPLDQPPGGIAGLVAQGVAVPVVSAAA